MDLIGAVAQNTWIERTKNDLSVALTEEVLPIAANVATLALVGLDLTDIARRPNAIPLQNTAGFI